METHYTDTQDYTTGNQAALEAIEPALKDAFKAAPDGNAMTVVGAADGYTIVSTSKGKNKVEYTLQVDANGTTRTCAPVSKGGCNAAGTW
jgi:hypothetical protein